MASGEFCPGTQSAAVRSRHSLLCSSLTRKSLRSSKPRGLLPCFQAGQRIFREYLR